MTPREVKNLTYFRDGERQLGGSVVDWATYDYDTMLLVEYLRERVESPVLLIRGAHPNKPTAIDGVCPDVPLERVLCELTYLPCSWGLYEGGSWHLDRRPGGPAHWLGLREKSLLRLKEAGLGHLATPPKDGWLYLPLAGPHGWQCLNLILSLSNE